MNEFMLNILKPTQEALVVKNSPANTRDLRCGFALWIGKISGGQHGNPL